ncbi:MAG: glycosyltransferase [Thaumarchaeota archaeon]|nr:glycosyltransferase [Nitrososphaerota archaeon]
MGNLKILHINDGDLDDPRIVNAGLTGKKAGFDEYFCGENLGHTFKTDVFTKLIWITIPSRARIAKKSLQGLAKYWKWYPYTQHAIELEGQIKKVIDEIRPDIVHAHNIFVAHHVSNLGIPMVLDDHELYSLHIQAQNENAGFRKKMITRIKHNLWGEWEEEIGHQHPVITVSGQIADSYKKFCKNVFVLPNYPNKNAIRFDYFSEAIKGNVCSAYLGRDLEQNPSAVRNISGLQNVFSTDRNTGKLLRIGVSQPNTARIRSVGVLSMENAYKTLNWESQIGLLPWHKHWFHQYCSPNKVYEYAHCGLWLATIGDLKPVIDDFGKHCDRFNNYDEMTELLEHYNDNPEELNKKRQSALEYARENMIWEKHEQKILQAYKVA